MFRAKPRKINVENFRAVTPMVTAGLLGIPRIWQKGKSHNFYGSYLWNILGTNIFANGCKNTLRCLQWENWVVFSENSVVFRRICTPSLYSHTVHTVYGWIVRSNLLLIIIFQLLIFKQEKMLSNSRKCNIVLHK